MNKTVSVAPMMDCTDKHEIYFLSLISKNIHLYTEMIVANAITRGDRNKLLSFKKISNPVKKAFLNLFVNEVFNDFFFST